MAQTTEGAAPAGALDPATQAAPVAAAAAGFPAFTASGAYSLETTRDLSVGEPILFFALSLIIVGVGFLKANISTVVGALYEE
ncbi:MAG: hypothetical protein EON88_33170, partial [Brevundimonas sp.]